MKWLQIEDTSWWPDLYGDDLEWKLRHSRETLTTGDLLNAAAVLRAYQDLIRHPAMTGKKVDMIRRAIDNLDK